MKDKVISPRLNELLGAALLLKRTSLNISNLVKTITMLIRLREAAKYRKAKECISLAGSRFLSAAMFAS
jgi:hypothetical protein